MLANFKRKKDNNDNEINTNGHKQRTIRPIYLLLSYYYYYYCFLPSVDMFPKEFKN